MLELSQIYKWESISNKTQLEKKKIINQSSIINKNLKEEKLLCSKTQNSIYCNNIMQNCPWAIRFLN